MKCAIVRTKAGGLMKQIADLQKMTTYNDPKDYDDCPAFDTLFIAKDDVEKSYDRRKKKPARKFTQYSLLVSSRFETPEMKKQLGRDLKALGKTLIKEGEQESEHVTLTSDVPTFMDSIFETTTNA